MPSPSTENCYRVRTARRTVHAALTNGGSPLFLYHSARASSRTPSPMTVKCHRGEALNEKSPHYAPKTVTARNAATCANALFPRVLTGESRNIVTFDSAYRLLCAPADGRVAALDPALHQGGKTVMGRLQRGVLTLSLCRQNRYTPSLIGERCYSLYSLTCANVARSPAVHLAHTTSLQLTASMGCKLHPRLGVSRAVLSRFPVDLHVLGLEPLPRPRRQHRHLAQRPDDRPFLLQRGRLPRSRRTLPRRIR